LALSLLLNFKQVPRQIKGKATRNEVNQIWHRHEDYDPKFRKSFLVISLGGMDTEEREGMLEGPWMQTKKQKNNFHPSQKPHHRIFGSEKHLEIAVKEKNS
jgi:hypothetical protein